VSATAPRDPLDIQAIVARIDRDLTESRRAREEAFKLMDERQKLEAETAKLRRDYNYAAWVPIAGMIGGAIAIAQLILHAFHLI
jgi:hypothetical protein